MLERYFERIQKIKGVEFVILDGGLKLACAVDVRGLSLEEIKQVIEQAKC
ncbi:MAG: hypothetical protein ACN2B6_00645 [Rickettsiales bacterium]